MLPQGKRQGLVILLQSLVDLGGLFGGHRASGVKMTFLVR